MCDINKLVWLLLLLALLGSVICEREVLSVVHFSKEWPSSSDWNGTNPWDQTTPKVEIQIVGPAQKSSLNYSYEVQLLLKAGSSANVWSVLTVEREYVLCNRALNSGVISEKGLSSAVWTPFILGWESLVSQTSLIQIKGTLMSPQHFSKTACNGDPSCRPF